MIIIKENKNRYVRIVKILFLLHKEEILQKFCKNRKFDLFMSARI